jgi:hypothetical protein
VTNLKITAQEWAEAIAPYNFEATNVQVDDPDTVENIILACEELAGRRTEKKQTPATSLGPELGREVILMREALRTSNDRVGQSLATAAKVMRSLEGRIAMLEIQLKQEREGCSELKSEVLNLRSAIEELRSTPRVETQRSSYEIPAETQREYIFTGEFDSLFESTWS